MIRKEILTLSFVLLVASARTVFASENNPIHVTQQSQPKDYAQLTPPSATKPILKNLRTFTSTYRPQNVTITSDGIFVTSPLAVTQYDQSGKIIQSYTSHWLFKPHGLAVTPNGSVMITTPETYNIIRLDKNLKNPNPWHSPDKSCFSDMAIGDHENIFLLDWERGRILKFNSSFEHISTFGRQGILPGQFMRPSGIAINSRGDLIVVDKANERVQVLDGDTGEAKFLFKCYGNYVAVDALDRIYVSGESQIKIFSADGRLLQTITAADNLRPFRQTQGIAISKAATGPGQILFICDQDNRQVLAADIILPEPDESNTFTSKKNILDKEFCK